MIVLWGLKTAHIDETSKGEDAMKNTEMVVYKEQLLALRARLRGDVTQMSHAALHKSRSEANGDLSSMPIHMADIGSDNYEQEFTLSLIESDGGTLTQIETSLERIEEGTYGQCEECGAKIPKSRLNAIPYATLCVRCAELQERHS
jgi:DnaK suppressor protein